MSKYRLCYLNRGSYVDVKLDKLECLMDRKTTDIEVIDEFTTKFNNISELLEFLKRNKLIPIFTNRLYITIDNKNSYKKIYNGHKLLFKEDSEYLKLSYIYKWIVYNKDNSDLMISIAENYIEKYQNAYNRTTGASYILSLFNAIKHIALNKNNNIMETNELKEFDKCISEFIDFEFYKIDKKKFDLEKEIEKKTDKDGKHIKQYRNIHDFIILIKSLDKNLERYLNNIKSEEKEIISYDDYKDEYNEDYLTYDDYKRTNKKLIDNYKEDNFEPYRDGNDYIVPLIKEELEECLEDNVRKLCRRF